jgi:hypothetical protein
LFQTRYRANCFAHLCFGDLWFCFARNREGDLSISLFPRSCR